MAGSVMAGALVHDDGCAVAAHLHGRGDRNPEIFADLHAKGEVGEFLAAEQHTGAKGHQIAAQLDGRQLLGGGLEPAQFAELVIIGQIGLGHNAENLTLVQNCGAVVQLAQVAKGKTHHKQQGQFSGVGYQLLQRLQRAVLQPLLEEQIPAAVTCDRQFGGDQQTDTVADSRTGGFCDARSVISAVGEPHGGRHRGNFDKTVFHNLVSLLDGFI